MAKKTFSSDVDQHDPKVFRESFGSFGTTTRPGANQLIELQTKVRQGVKHVELHLASRGKGHFGEQDVPDKYGFEQRRTIMQLAKLNNQTLSVHGSFDVVSFSGLGNSGFNEAERANAIKEIDETIKFASETAKGGAVVFHIQGDIPSSRGSLNVSEEYLEWLKKNNPKEYEKIKENYLKENPLDRGFIDNIHKKEEIMLEYNSLSEDKKKRYEENAKKSSQKKGRKVEPWEEYFMESEIEKIKAAPDYSPYVVVGDKITSAPREEKIVDFESIKKLSKEDKKKLEKLDIHLGNEITLEDYERLNSTFTNGKPEYNEISESEFEDLKKKLLLTYDKVLEKKNFIQSHADKEFYKKLISNKIEMLNLQKEDILFTSEIYSDIEKEIKEITSQERKIYEEIKKAKEEGDLKKVRQLKKKIFGENLTDDEENELRRLLEKEKSGFSKLTEVERNRFEELKHKITSKGTARKKLELVHEIGNLEYQKLEEKDKLLSKINESKSELSLKKDEIKSLVEESFNKNYSAIGTLGIKALEYQLDLKKKSEIALEKKKEINQRILELEKKYNETSDYETQNKIATQIQKEKYELRRWVGVKDYEDIDLLKRPLYLAPENMLPGMGSLTSLEEFKAIIRMSQKDFAEKIVSDDPRFKKIREDYEKETGIKISKENAFEIAKNHIGGTFDNAHGATWLKHFKRKDGETEEERIKRFNEWFNKEAEEMYKEGIIKHVHFNDTQGKDDDHNLIGQGILDVHDLKDRLRKAGLKEAFIVEAGGRGAGNILQLQNTWNIFNPSLFADHESQGGTGYRPSNSWVSSQEVSDWVSVDRTYKSRPQYSQYGLGYSAFSHSSSNNEMAKKGDWSGQSLL